MDENTNTTASVTNRAVSKVCFILKRAGIKPPNQRHSLLKKKLVTFFKDKCREGFESRDRRFLLTPNSLVHFQSSRNQISMSLSKLIAALSLKQFELYTFLLKLHNNNNRHTRISKDDKLLIKHFVRLSTVRKKDIPCQKIRAIC